MIVFVVGGAKSKKSFHGESFAEKLWNDKGNLYYLATMKPYDEEDRRRIEGHIKSRDGHGFKTIEKEKDIEKVINRIDKEDTILLDSITSLVTNEIFLGDKVNTEVREKILKGIVALSKATRNLVIVSDYLFMDSIIYDEYTEIFRREIGNLNCDIANLSHVVVESLYGTLIYHKGEKI